MPILMASLDPVGPVVSAIVAVSGPRQEALRAEGRPIPRALVIRALVDTGASCTVVDPQVVRGLGLSPSGSVPVHTASTGGSPQVFDQYDIALGLVMDEGQVHVSSWTIPVIESNLSGQAGGIQALIGRDVLSQALLIYDGRHRTLTLSF